MLLRRFCVILAFISPLLSSFPLKAQVISPKPLPSPQKSTYTSQKLQVGFAGEPPAVISSETGELSGINVAIWAELAKKLNLLHGNHHLPTDKIPNFTAGNYPKMAMLVALIPE